MNTLLYNSLTPPGNIINEDISINYKQSYNYSNNFNFNNLNTVSSSNIPSYTFIESNIPTNDSVIICCGGGWWTLVVDPEISDAVNYWKTQNINIWILFYRTPILQNNLGNPYSINDYYNMNAYPFLLIYDLNTLVNIVKSTYPTGKLGLNGFSAGGNLVSVYASIMSYNSNIMTDIINIVDDTINNPTLPFPSMNFTKFITAYKNNEYLQDINYTKLIDFLLLMYPIVDLTIPQELNLKSFLNPFIPFNVINSLYSLTLLYSNKLFSDGVSNPLENSGTMSLITSNYPPTYYVSTLTDPFIQITIGNIFCQNLINNNVNIYRQLYPNGGHGFGLGYCFNSLPTYPLNTYPYKFFERTIVNTQNIDYGSDFVNSSYINSPDNTNNWFNPPINPTPNNNYIVPQISFNNFLNNIL
jgi:hypothetical protein